MLQNYLYTYVDSGRENRLSNELPILPRIEFFPSVLRLQNGFFGFFDMQNGFFGFFDMQNGFFGFFDLQNGFFGFFHLKKITYEVFRTSFTCTVAFSFFDLQNGFFGFFHVQNGLFGFFHLQKSFFGFFHLQKRFCKSDPIASYRVSNELKKRKCAYILYWFYRM